MFKNFLSNSLLVLISSFLGGIIFLLLLEAGLHLTGRGEPKPHFETGNYGWSTWSGADHLSDKPHSSQINQFGFRGQPYNPESSLNIILLGDSQVETSHKLHQMPERYLSDALRKHVGFAPNVISIGSWGFGTDQQYLALKEHIDDIKPAYVVLWFTSNDYRDNSSAIGFIGRKPTFWLTEQGLQGPNYQFLEKFRPEDTLKSIRVLRRNGLWFQSLNSQEGFYNKHVKPNLPEQVKYECSSKAIKGFDFAKYYSDQMNRQDEYDYFYEAIYSENGYYKLGSQSGIFYKYSYPRPSFLEYQKNLTRTLLKKIESLVETQDSKLLVLNAITPDELFKSPKIICDELRGELSYDQKNLRSLYNETLEGFKVLNVENISPDYGDNFDGHLNSKANMYVMKEVADFIAKELN